MISIIITSFKEPKTIGKAIESFINQNIKEDYELYVISPDVETLNVAKKYKKKYKNIKLLRDPGKGKSYAINYFLPRIKGRILILSDGDVYVSNNSVNLLVEAFNNLKIGCVAGQPVSLNSRKNIFGYWSHLLCDSANYLRKLKQKQNQFLECSGYLWAFRNNIIKKFPIDVAEDTVVPLLFNQKGYKIGYIPEVKVYVKFPNNLNDFIEQKKRTAKAHESLSKYINLKKIPRMKTFSSEISGSFFVLPYSSNFKEFLWTLLLFPIRFYIWILVFYHTYIKREYYQDAWKKIKSTK